MDWVEEFYSVTDSWWGAAEAQVNDIDRARSAFINNVSPSADHVLELGCGYGTTSVALAQSGLDVIAIDLSDRIERAPNVARGTHNVRFVRGDFYTADIADHFDIVCYWDGFGIGEDADQIRLLRRIADDWLRPQGFAVIEVFHPDGWKSDDGLEEMKDANPSLGYAHRLGHRRSFDHITSRAIDSWWELSSARSFSQSLRCYQPDEFRSLASAAGLDVVAIADSIDQTDSNELPWSFIATLRRSGPRQQPQAC